MFGDLQCMFLHNAKTFAYNYPQKGNYDNIISRIENFSTLDSEDDMIKKNGGGSCYCIDSFLFSYYYFLRNPYSIETLYNVVNAGGDTDSNGSIVGGLLGLLNGSKIFPSHLLDNLQDRDKIEEVANKFFGVLGSN